MKTKKVKDYKKINAVLFDMDGVILNSMPYHVRAWKDAFKERGMEVDERLFYLYEGAIEPDVACRLFAKNGTELTLEDFFDIHRKQKKYFLERYSRYVRPFEKVPKLLEWLKGKGTKIGLVTSSHGEILEAVLPASLKCLFDHVVTGDEVKRRKPHPDPYLKGLKGLDAAAGNGNVAVENAPAGIESATKAGLRCIAITTTLTKQHLENADTVVESHEELVDVLKRT